MSISKGFAQEEVATTDVSLGYGTRLSVEQDQVLQSRMRLWGLSLRRWRSQLSPTELLPEETADTKIRRKRLSLALTFYFQSTF